LQHIFYTDTDDIIMKSFLTFCLIAALNMTLTAAFSITRTSTTQRQATLLKYTVIGGIEEEETADASDEAEPNFWAQRKADKNGGPGDLSGYAEKDDLFLEIDNAINVDAYTNGVSGGIMPGFQLTGLMGDD
jgi:hypothetical protein